MVAPPSSPTGRAILSKPLLDLKREKQVLEATLAAEEAELGRQSFWYFLTQILYPDVWTKHYSEEFHRPICDMAENLAQGTDLWVFLQREARKSFIFNIAHNTWRIIRDPDIRILVCGARLETVKPFMRVQRAIFDEGTPGFEKFRSLYPEFIFHGRGKMLKQAFQFTVPARKVVLPDPTIRATYRGVAGAGWRTDLLVFDDCLERRDVTTPEASLKALNQMLDLIPLVSKTSRHQNVIGLGTRWAYHDPYGRLLGESEDLDGAEEALERFRSRQVKVVIRHAVEDPEKLCEHCPAHVTLGWPHGHPVPPEGDEGVVPLDPIQTRESLIATLNRYRANPSLGESLWWHQYQNVCVAPASQKFKTEWYELVLDKPGWPVPKKRVLSVDSADKDFQRKGVGDYMVALFGEFDDYGRLALRYGIRNNKWTRHEFIERIVAYCMSVGWWPSLLLKEKFGTDNFLSDLQKAFLKAFHPVHAMTVTRPQYNGVVMKKYDWIVEALQAPMERGEVVFGSSFTNELRGRMQYEGTNLAQTAHDDTMDALALFFVPGVRPKQWVGQPINRPPSWQPPAMQLYDPASQAPVGPVMNPQQAQQQRVTTIFDDAGFSEVRWDQPGSPQSFKLDIDV